MTTYELLVTLESKTAFESAASLIGCELASTPGSAVLGASALGPISIRFLTLDEGDFSHEEYGIDPRFLIEASCDDTGLQLRDGILIAILIQVWRKEPFKFLAQYPDCTGLAFSDGVHFNVNDKSDLALVPENVRLKAQSEWAG